VSHVAQILAKRELGGRAQTVVFAYQRGLITPRHG
jgi:hypothetical protein